MTSTSIAIVQWPTWLHSIAIVQWPTWLHSTDSTHLYYLYYHGLDNIELAGRNTVYKVT